MTIKQAKNLELYTLVYIYSSIEMAAEEGFLKDKFLCTQSENYEIREPYMIHCDKNSYWVRDLYITYEDAHKKLMKDIVALLKAWGRKPTCYVQEVINDAVRMCARSTREIISTQSTIEKHTERFLRINEKNTHSV